MLHILLGKQNIDRSRLFSSNSHQHMLNSYHRQRMFCSLHGMHNRDYFLNRIYFGSIGSNHLHQLRNILNSIYIDPRTEMSSSLAQIGSQYRQVLCQMCENNSRYKYHKCLAIEDTGCMLNEIEYSLECRMSTHLSLCIYNLESIFSNVEHRRSMNQGKKLLMELPREWRLGLALVERG